MVEVGWGTGTEMVSGPKGDMGHIEMLLHQIMPHACATAVAVRQRAAVLINFRQLWVQLSRVEKPHDRRRPTRY